MAVLQVVLEYVADAVLQVVPIIALAHAADVEEDVEIVIKDLFSQPDNL